MSQEQEGEGGLIGCLFNTTVKKFSLEVEILERKVRLYNACGFHSGSQDVLLSWNVGGLGYPVQVVQVAERSV